MQGQRRHYRQNKNNVSRKVREVEAWGQRGIYAIYSDFKLVYVGEAISSKGIGARLFAHHSKPQLHGRWDSFSWFGIDGYGADGNLVPYQPITVTAPTLARTLELVAVLVADPPMNRAQGRFKGAERIDQARVKGADASVEEMLEMLKKVTGQLEGFEGKITPEGPALLLSSFGRPKCFSDPPNTQFGTVALTGLGFWAGTMVSCSGVVGSQSRSSWSVCVGTASTGSRTVI